MGTVARHNANAGHHTIKTVAQRTGLTPHVIRIWEKRYGAVKPARTGTNRRRYSDEQVERLRLLRAITHGGHSIGPVATLPLDTLRRLAAETNTAVLPTHDAPNEAPARVRRGASAEPSAHALLDECLVAIRQFDAQQLESTLKRSSVELGAQGLLQRVIGPLAQTIGDLWRDGTLTAAHEHFASAMIRIFLGNATRAFAAAENAPVLVVATPSGQLHELGALLAAAAAAGIGWHVTYLGVSLPAAEIAGAVRQNRARAVALSLVYPEDDPRLEGELSRLRELLPPGTPLLIGGRAAPAYRAALEKISAQPTDDLAQFCAALDQLRKPA